MSYATALKCRKCGQEYPIQPVNLCELCLSQLEVVYDTKLSVGKEDIDDLITDLEQVLKPA